MEVKQFLQYIDELGIDFFTGVPDSLLSPLCDTLYLQYGSKGKQHIVAANEGNAVGLAAGHYIASGRPALVYMQNSGIGNAVNPIASLLHEQVYGIPCLFVVGWRGEPGIYDEPQHKFQGVVTVETLELMDIKTFILEKNNTPEETVNYFVQCRDLLRKRKCAAIVIRKGALTCGEVASYGNANTMTRERVLELVLKGADREGIFVSTTGKTSRELFELREKRNEDHGHDFLTVGSMGHALMIALGIAMEKPERTVWCIDGDGAAVMHLGGLAIAAGMGCKNLIHIVINNAAHESVGGMPVATGRVDFSALAKAAGYESVFRADSEDTLCQALADLKNVAKSRFLEVHTALGSRSDLGRPTITPKENLEALRKVLK